MQNTLNLLNVDGVSSPNDFACILANGRAGNYKISAVDTDYKKFASALNAVMANVCEKIAESALETYAVCKVLGARSMKTARAFAKAVAGAQAVRNAIKRRRVRAEDFVCVACDVNERVAFEKLTVSVNGVVVLEDGRKNVLSVEVQETALKETKTEIIIRIGDGNYSATSVFCL